VSIRGRHVEIRMEQMGFMMHQEIVLIIQVGEMLHQKILVQKPAAYCSQMVPVKLNKLCI